MYALTFEALLGLENEGGEGGKETETKTPEKSVK